MSYDFAALIAIGYYCLKCSDFPNKHPADCINFKCPLYPFRFGCMPQKIEKRKNAGGTRQCSAVTLTAL